MGWVSQLLGWVGSGLSKWTRGQLWGHARQRHDLIGCRETRSASARSVRALCGSEFILLQVRVLQTDLKRSSVVRTSCQRADCESTACARAVRVVRVANVARLAGSHDKNTLSSETADRTGCVKTLSAEPIIGQQKKQQISI